MSRCFPYPPPGFTKKASDVATLIDSIKLQKESKPNKEKRKEKRRDKGEKDKKDKKRDRKEKKESVDFKDNKVDFKDNKVSHEAHKDGKKWIESDGVLSQKRKLQETEQLEGSSVTEEHGQPLNVQNPSYSSEGTQNSNKRRKQSSVGNGNIIRIKLPLQKHKESECKVSKEQLDSTSSRSVLNQASDVKARVEEQCSTSGRNEIDNEQFCSRSGWTDPFVSRASQVDVSLTFLRKSHLVQSFPCPSKELCSTSGKAVDVAQGLKQTTVSFPDSCLTSRDKKLQKKVSKYDNLIQNLYQIAVPSEVVESDAEDWLFGGKLSDAAPAVKRNVEKRLPGVASTGSLTLYPLYPRAQFLEEGKIFALPYTVPF